MKSSDNEFGNMDCAKCQPYAEQLRVLLTTNQVKCPKHYKWLLPSILGSHHQYQRRPSETIKIVRMHQKKGIKNNCAFGNMHCVKCQP
jgi:hypothetical protein